MTTIILTLFALAYLGIGVMVCRFFAEQEKFVSNIRWYHFVLWPVIVIIWMIVLLLFWMVERGREP